MTELTERLARNAKFYANESLALSEDLARRDRRQLGAKEAATISQLLHEAKEALELKATP